MNNIDCFITMASERWWDILDSKWTYCWCVESRRREEMDKQKDSKNAALMECSRTAVVRIYQKWSKERKMATGSWVAKSNWWMWGAKADLCSLTNRRATVAQIVKKLLLFLIQRCQNTQCISVWCVWVIPWKNTALSCCVHTTWQLQNYDKVPVLQA